MKYQKEFERLLNEDLYDIIIFGSSVRGGTPEDIDIALITAFIHHNGLYMEDFFQVCLCWHL